MTNNINAKLDTDLIADNVDQFSAQLDAQGFPVVEIDLETGTMIVDASTDYDKYSVLMAIVTAFENCGFDPDDLDITV